MTLEKIAKVAERVITKAPQSQVEYQAEQWSKRMANGELEAALAGKLPSAQDLEDARNCKPGKPELSSSEEATSNNPKATPTPEKTIMSIVASGAPHVMMSTADRIARLARADALRTNVTEDWLFLEVVIPLDAWFKDHPADGKLFSQWQIGEYEVDIPDLELAPFDPIPYSSLGKSDTPLDMWRLVTYKALPAPALKPEVKAEPEKWVAVIEAIAKPIEIVSIDVMPGIYPVTSYDRSDVELAYERRLQVVRNMTTRAAA